MILKKIIILAILLNLCAVGAADLQEHDFDGDFKMDVPYGTDFEKTSSFFGLDIGPTKVYQDFKNDINISYISVSDDEKYFNEMIETIENEPNVNMTKEDELYLITTEKYNIVLFEKNHKIFAISAGDLAFDSMKHMAKSTK